MHQILRNGESLLVADTDERFIDGCNKLLAETDFCVGLAQRGSELVAQHYSFERFQTAISEAIRQVISHSVTASSQG
jgi:hypothetical protein